MLHVAKLVFYLLLLKTCVCYLIPLKIGAIFDKNNENKLRAFQYVTKEVNETRILYNHEVVPIIKQINYDNPFEALQAACSLIEEGVVGILGPNSEDNSNIVQSICDEKDIPHLDVRWDDQLLTGAINIYPHPDVLIRVYKDILDAWEWTDFVILYENNESLRRVGELLRIYNTSDHQVIIRQLDKQNTGNYRPVLKEVWRTGALHFVLDCSIEILEEVLRQAQQVGLMTNRHNYIITNLDLQSFDVSPFQYSETNITGLRFFDPDDTPIQTAAESILQGPLAVASNLQLEATLVVDAIMMFAEALKKLPSDFELPEISCESAGSWEHGSTTLNNIKALRYPGLTGEVRFNNTGYRSEFALEIFELREGGNTKIGEWNATNGLVINRPVIAKPIVSERDMPLKNKTFIVITALTEPYAMLKDSTSRLSGNDAFEGYSIDLIKELAEMEGFNYTFIERKDKSNGSYNATTGKWTGMIGDILDHKADLALADLTITSERAEHVAFTVPYMYLGIGILFQEPQKKTAGFFTFADPFAFEVWKLLAAAYFGVSISLFILGRTCPAEWTNPYPCNEDPEFLINQINLKNSLWINIGSLMQQGCDIAPIGVSTRMVAGMWWFFTLLMVATYTANLAAFLTDEKPDRLFSSARELVANAEKFGIKYGAKKNGATEAFFKEFINGTTPEAETYRKIYEYMQKNQDEVMVRENSDGVVRAADLDTKYAFFMESTSIEYETQRRCDLEQVGGKLDEKGYGIAMRPNSTYRNQLSTAILRLMETGKLTDIKRKWWEERKGGGQCQAEEKSDATPLDLKNVGGVFAMTIGGTICAFFWAIGELISRCIKTSMKTKTPFMVIFKEEIKFLFKFSKNTKAVLEHTASQETLDRDGKTNSQRNSKEKLSNSHENI